MDKAALYDNNNNEPDNKDRELEITNEGTLKYISNYPFIDYIMSVPLAE